MTEWTREARDEARRCFDRMRSRLGEAGADPLEVAEDLERHVEEEVQSTSARCVTRDDVRRVLGRMGLYEEPAAEPVLPAVWGFPRPWFVMLFGILLPAFTVGYEAIAHFCAQHFFDPVPTPWHVAVTAFVPATNLGIWWAVRRPGRRFLRLLGVANGAALGIALYYALVFLPLAPLALIACLAGVGFLPLSPALSFAAGLVCRRALAGREPAGVAPRGLWTGMALGVLAVLAANAPSTSTRIGLAMATSPSAETRADGIRWLRRWGNEGALLHHCYGGSNHPDPIAWLLALHRNVSEEKAREVWFRVTGRPFNAEPRPDRREEGMFVFDRDGVEEQAGIEVAGRVPDLSLASSRIDGRIEADAALAYLEWTLEFRSDSRFPSEARAEITLPPGGVVSRVTLWIDGHPAEAAFAGRSEARQAYQNVVQRRRDPLLVTTSGPDGVLVQCFPVPPGGTMKIRIGVTAPLVLESLERGRLRLPSIAERNFDVPEETQHSVWIESDGAVDALGEHVGASPAGPSRSRGDRSSRSRSASPRPPSPGTSRAVSVASGPANARSSCDGSARRPGSSTRRPTASPRSATTSGRARSTSTRPATRGAPSRRSAARSVSSSVSGSATRVAAAGPTSRAGGGQPRWARAADRGGRSPSPSGARRPELRDRGASIRPASSPGL